MTERGPFAVVVGLCVLVSLTVLLAPACSENGQSGNCPPLSRYNINDAGNDASVAKIAAENAAAVDAGCMTPLSDASTGGASN